jgi:hypothetical protein
MRGRKTAGPEGACNTPGPGLDAKDELLKEAASSLAVVRLTGPTEISI